MVSQELYQEMIYVMLVGIIFLFISLTYNYVRGIDYMNENHPNYKGEDMFGEEENYNNMGTEVHLGMVIGTLVTLLVVFLFQTIDWKKKK